MEQNLLKTPIHGADYSMALTHLKQNGLVTIQDAHLAAPHSIHNYDQIKDLLERGAIGLGDIIDLPNCKRSQADKWLRRYEYLATNTNYIDGNHEIFSKGHKTLKVGQKLFTHGHHEFYNEKRISRWKQKKIGKNFWRFQIYRLKHLRSGKNKELKIKPEILYKLYELCKQNECTELYIGHTHRYLNASYSIKNYGFKIIACPRGISLH